MQEIGTKAEFVSGGNDIGVQPHPHFQDTTRANNSLALSLSWRLDAPASDDEAGYSLLVDGWTKIRRDWIIRSSASSVGAIIVFFADHPQLVDNILIGTASWIFAAVARICKCSAFNYELSNGSSSIDKSIIPPKLFSM